VTTPNPGDSVTVHISGLPRYETITDNLDHKTFRGNSITLTAAEVNSGLTLDSHYRGHGQPTATLTITATDTTGTPITSAPQTITVKDPPAAATSSTTSTTASGGGKSASMDVAQWFNQHPGFAQAATTLGESGTSKSGVTPNAGTAADPAASTSAKSFALFNQMMAGDFGNDSHFAQATTAPSGSPQQSSNFLTKPLH